MKIGIPKEIKNNESRVGMTPAGVFELTKNNHIVYVQSTAGEGSGFFDKDYQEVGATILPSIQEVYSKSEMIVKVKEPIEEEYPLIQENQIVFTYFHFASSETLTKAMMKSKSVCIACRCQALNSSSSGKAECRCIRNQTCHRRRRVFKTTNKQNCINSEWK